MTVYTNEDPESGVFQLYGDNEEACVKANEFLAASSARGLTPKTVRAYAFDLVRLFRWLEDIGMEFDELPRLELIDFIRVQRKDGAEPASINRRLSTASLFCRFAFGVDPLREGRIQPGPHYKGRGRDRDLGLHALHRRYPKLRVKVPKKLVEPLEPTEVVAFMRSFRRYRDLAIVSLMLLCGLRTKEVLAARLGDVNLLQSRVRVRGKGEIERMLPLPQQIASVISDYNQLERPLKSASDHLFVVLQGSSRGQPMTASGVRSLFRHRRNRRNQLARANPHRFRHTFGADMARAGVQLPVLQKMMGHADSRTTLRYVNLSMSDVAEEFMKVAEAIRRRYRSA